MPSYKRARSPVFRVSPYPSSSARKGSGRYGVKRTRGASARIIMRSALSRLNQTAASVQRLNRMIETKECTRGSSVNINMPHNNLYIIQDQSAAGDLNMFNCAQGVTDPMARGAGSRIGDKISLRGVLIRGMFENSLGRAKVFFRVMVIKCAKGDVPTRATLFKNDSANKMIDQVNTERFTVVAQTTFNISCTNLAPNAVGATGVPASGTSAGIGTKCIKMWIPGSKFGRQGNLTYEDGSATQLKFHDYKVCVLCYDWLGTPQDVNNVGLLNELYTKLYFKDA